MSIRTLVMGLGKMGQRHALAYHNHTGFEIVGKPKPEAGQEPVTDVRVGTRNYVAVISTVNCSASVSHYVRDRFRTAEFRRDFPNVEVCEITGLAVQFVRKAGARIMLRGLRTLSDMEYEFTMSQMNLNLDPGIETVFLMAKEEFSHVSSSLLRQIAQLGGDLTKFLPEPVKVALVERARRK